MLRMVALARANDKGAKVEILNLGNLDPAKRLGMHRASVYRALANAA